MELTTSLVSRPFGIVIHCIGLIIF